MRQPRTFSERLALLNRFNRRQAPGLGEEEEEDELEEGVPGAEEEDSESEANGDMEDNGFDSDSDSEDGSDDEDEPEESEVGAAAPTAPPAVGASADVEEPEAEESETEEPEEETGAEESAPESQTPGSMTIINPPTQTGVVNNPAVTSPELSTTQEVVSQITSAAVGELASETVSGPLASNSLAQEEQAGTGSEAGTETEAGTEAEATREEVEGESQNVPALDRGAQVGIIIGALGLMMALGFLLFKWRKRRNASVYDRPPPPGIYSEDDKRDAEVTIAYAGEEQGGSAAPREDGMFQKVSSWVKATADRYSREDVAAPAPAFALPGRNRDTGSDTKWG